jgi:hypothetical protein
MATPRKTTSRAQRLLDHHRLRGRAYPALRYWERLHLMLSEEAEKRGKSPPPTPLVHGGLEAEATEADRMDRLDEQVAWADHNQLLHKVQMFFDAMPGSGWEEQGAKRGKRP